MVSRSRMGGGERAARVRHASAHTFTRAPGTHKGRTPGRARRRRGEWRDRSGGAYDGAMRRTHAPIAVGLTALALLACGSPGTPNDPVTRADRADGQWVWSAADAARFAESRRADPALLPGVWVATIAFAGDSVTQRLARAPAAAPGTRGTPVAALVRFDDAVHRAWDVMDDRALAAALGARLGRLLAALDGSGARVTEVQLDYDCPERRLARWAAVVRALGRGPLAGRPLRVTSIPAHVRHADYGTLFRGAVAGHVVQVFDTGDRFDAAA